MELSTQCQFARECDRRLREAAPGWYENATNEEVENRKAPRDIIIDCTAFLSAAGIISKLLFPGKNNRRVGNGELVNRCKALRELLDIRDNDLPLLQNLAVRNDFEHVDERLDRELRSFNKGGFSSLSVYEKEPNAEVILKRFDPKKLTISNSGNVYLVWNLGLDQFRQENE
jgi:hypothetical protein